MKLGNIASLTILTGFAALVSACGGEQKGILPDRDSQYLQATSHYGPLHVRLGRTPVYRAKARPWTSYWFPKGETVLFDGSNSPLQKYDQYVRATRGTDGKAAEFERRSYESRRWDAWEGHCDAWSIASILQQPEPRGAKLPGGIRLSAEEVKALVIKSYETLAADPNGRSPLLYFGWRYNGLAGERPEERFADDIHPDQFHRVLQAEIAQKKRPFIMDKDPDVAVWNFPIYAWYSDIHAGASENELHVQTSVQYVNPRQSFEGDLLAETVWKDYTYTLFGQKQPDGSYLIYDGAWLGSSVQDHPDFLTVIPEALDPSSRRSRNTAIDTSIIDEILGYATES